MKTLLSFLTIAAVLYGCSYEEQYKYTDIDKTAPITMIGEVNDGDDDNNETITRGVGAVAQGTALGISLFREDETYDATYDAGPVAATLTAARTIDTGLYYLAGSTAKSKLIGVYPTGATYASAARTLTYSSIDGATDIMSSSLVEGSKGTPITTMTFDHLLTRIVVNVKATDATVAALWGNVTAITVAGKKQDIVMTLPAANATGKATVAGSGSATALPLTLENGGAVTAKTLTTSDVIFGQAMFAPVTTAAQLSLSVTTSIGGTNTVNTASQLYEAGKTYVINLTFSTTEIKMTGVTITAWGTTTPQNHTLN